MFLLFRRRSFLTVVIISTLLVVGGFFMILNNQPATSPTLSWIMGEKTFLVDPGHGGTFPGRVNEDKVLEKEINLDIALKLDQLHEETGAQVIMTRRADTDLIPPESKEEKLLLQQRADLEQRIKMSEQAKADYFISIHCNSIPNDKWQGAQTFYNPEDPEAKNWRRPFSKCWWNSWAIMTEKLCPGKTPTYSKMQQYQPLSWNAAFYLIRKKLPNCRTLLISSSWPGPFIWASTIICLHRIRNNVTDCQAQAMITAL